MGLFRDFGEGGDSLVFLKTDSKATGGAFLFLLTIIADFVFLVRGGKSKNDELPLRLFIFVIFYVSI